jgi:nitroreductase
MSLGNAPVDHPIHELLARRHSPYAFDPGRGVSESDLASLFEAARWAMSSYNAQPWRYIVGSRDRSPETWERIFGVLVEGNQPWARNAPVLALGIVRSSFEYNGKPNRAAEHDLGAASALLTVEATARGLVVHQMIGIEPEKAREEFGLDAEHEALTALAIGYAGDAGDIPDAYAERDRGERQRKPLSEIIIAGSL